jgi:purine-binding chemotaxis protein CheW
MATNSAIQKPEPMRGSTQFSTFCVAGLFFGVDVLHVQEVLLSQQMTPDKPPMNLVVRTADGAVSLLVDEIGDVLEMDPAAYERPPQNLASPARELIRGVYKLKDRLLLVLDA